MSMSMSIALLKQYNMLNGLSLVAGAEVGSAGADEGGEGGTWRIYVHVYMNIHISYNIYTYM